MTLDGIESTSMAARLTLVCCAATEATRKGAFPLDEPLSMRAGVPEYKVSRPDRTWISPALRATQTAELLALSGDRIAGLRDQDFGRWAGKRLVELQKSEPEDLALWLADPQSAPHGGESLADVVTRAASVLDELLPLRGHTVAVTHAAVIRAAVVHILGAPLQAFWKIDVEPLSATELTSDGKRWALRATSLGQ